MNHVLRILQAIALAALIALLSSLTLAIHRIQPQAQAFIRDAHITVLEAGLTAKNLRLATQDAQEATKQTITAEKAATKTFRDLDSTVIKIDANVNDSLLPEFGEAIFDADVSLQRVAHSAQASLSGVDDVTRAITAKIDDPQIQETIQHIDVTTGNLADTSKETAGISSDLHQETSILLAQTKKALEPEAKWKSVLRMAFNGTLSTAELVYYLTK
jgi:hypothetical protein